MTTMKPGDDVKFLALSRPDFTLEDAQLIARELYGIDADGKEFYAERDRSFYLRAGEVAQHPDDVAAPILRGAMRDLPAVLGVLHTRQGQSRILSRDPVQR